jgi:hypothetical protein
VCGIKCISRAVGSLPFEIVDAARSDAEVAAAAERGEVLVTVSQDIRLDNRVLDLRTPANQAIFRLQSAVGQVRSSGRGDRGERGNRGLGWGGSGEWEWDRREMSANPCKQDGLGGGCAR